MDDCIVNKLNARQQIALYRIVQEQMNNIIKHAEATSVELVLQEVENSICLDILDNGKGFDMEMKRAGIGLSNMQSRAELLNGKLKIRSEPERGCSLNVMLPMETENLF